MTTQISYLKIPEYDISKQDLDFSKIAKPIDDEIKKYFLEEDVIIRAISSSERHTDFMGTIYELIMHGYDKVNERLRVRGKNCPEAELWGVQHTVLPESVIAQNFLEKFYQIPVNQDSEPLKIDIFTIYDASKLEEIKKDIYGKDIKHTYKFKEQDKKAALKGIIGIQ